LIEEAQRLAHYPAVRLKTLLLREPVDLVESKRHWLAAVAEANALFLKLPQEEIGCLYLEAEDQAVTPDPTEPGFASLRRAWRVAGHYSKLTRLRGFDLG
jgi:hypothetical protein